MRYLLGLVSGLIISVVVFFILKPTLSKEPFNNGFEKGNAEGFDKGFIEGKAEQTKYYDSMMAERKAKTDSIVVQPKAPKPKATNNNAINYRMHGNEVGEEIKKTESESNQ